MTELTVHESGIGRDPSVVLLHGSGTNAAMWADQMRRLTRYHCLAPDLPGHGDSAEIPWESLADAADRVAEVIRVRSESGTACLVGLSLGGSVGYVLLAWHPELVSRAVVDRAAIVPNGLTPVLKAAVTLVSPLLHRRPVIRLMAKAFDIPPADAADLAQRAADHARR